MKKAMLTMAGLMLAAGMTSLSAAPEPKADVCHVPPGNPENVHVLSVGASAVPAHLAHGDYMAWQGSCQINRDY